MSILNIKNEISSLISTKYAGRFNEDIESSIAADMTQILVKYQKAAQINNFSNVTVKKMSDIIVKSRVVKSYTNTVKIRAAIYPSFVGSIIKFDFDVRL